MIPIPSGVRVWIATGHTDMRRGMQGLALQVQEQLKRDPHAGDLYIFRGRRGAIVKACFTTCFYDPPLIRSLFRRMRQSDLRREESGELRLASDAGPGEYRLELVANGRL